MKSLSLVDCRLNGGLELDGAAALENLQVSICEGSSLSLRNLPKLRNLDSITNIGLVAVRLEHLSLLPNFRHAIHQPSFEISLSDLPALRTLTLERAFYGPTYLGPPPVVWLRQADGLRSLTDVAMPRLRFRPETAVNLGRIASVRKLDLSNSWWGGTDMEPLHALVNLEECNLGCTEVSMAGLRQILTAPGLRKLVVGKSFVALTGDRLAELRAHLSLDVDAVEKPSPGLTEAAAAVRRGDRYAFWDRWAGDVRNDDLLLLRDLGDVQAFNLRNAHINDAGLRPLARLSKLRALSLSEVRITDAGLKGLSDMPALESLGLADTAIAGPGLQHLKGLPNLKALDLAETDLTDDGLANVNALAESHHAAALRCPRHRRRTRTPQGLAKTGMAGSLGHNGLRRRP